jgi:hypothetical protein
LVMMCVIWWFLHYAIISILCLLIIHYVCMYFNVWAYVYSLQHSLSDVHTSVDSQWYNSFTLEYGYALCWVGYGDASSLIHFITHKSRPCFRWDLLPLQKVEYASVARLQWYLCWKPSRTLVSNFVPTYTYSFIYT